jgi:hypothetical protein
MSLFPLLRILQAGVQLRREFSRVADPEYLSRIPDPDFYQSQIPYLGSRNQQQQQRRGKKFVVLHFFCSFKYQKIKIISFFNR